jgi:hypothetical protein
MALDLSLFNVPIDLGGKGNEIYQEVFIAYCRRDSVPGEIIIGPEGLFSSSEAMSVKDVGELTDLFTELSVGKLIIPGTVLHEKDGILQNTALVFSDGELILKYNKETESQESSIFDIPYKTGGNDNSTFSWQGKTYGLEICRDHGMGRLKRRLGKDNQPNVDYQIVLANNINYSRRNFAVVDDGLVILVDGNKSRPSVSVTDSQNSKFLEPVFEFECIKRYKV